MRNHPGAFRGFFSTLAAATFLAMTLSSCAVTVALPGGGSTTTPIKPPTNIGTGTGAGAGGGGTTETKPEPPEPTPEEPKPEEPKDEKPTETPKEENKEKPKEEPKKDPAPAPSPAKWSPNGKVLTGYTLPDDFSGTLVLPTDREYMVSAKAFQGENRIKQLVIPKNVLEIYAGAFQNCSNLTSVTIESTSTKLGSGLFRECKKLVSVYFPDGISEIPASTFFGCESLQGIALPESIKKIGNSAFENCLALESIALPTHLTEIGNYSFQKTGLAEIVFPKQLASVGINSFSQNQKLKDITFSNGTGTVNLGNGAFSHCESLNTVILRGNITSLPASLFQYSEINTLYIPATVDCIDMMAFDYDTPPKNIYFAGSKSEWDTLSEALYWSEDATVVVKYGESAPCSDSLSLLSNLLSIF